jgi:lipid-binding SYLF domain-containing protein
VAASTGLTEKDEKTLTDAVVALDALASAADQGVPRELLAKADCLLIFPSIDKGALFAGGKRGRGVASCRQPDGTMGPASFYTVGGASVGFQIGVQSADVLLLIMNEGGVDHLLADRFTIGDEATATAGPVGSTAPAATEAQMRAQILSWSRSGGLFVVAAFHGSNVKLDDRANARLYGEKTSGREILMDSTLAVPVSAQPLVDSIRRYMPAAVLEHHPDGPLPDLR